MSREDFLSKFDNPETIKNYLKSFRKFDGFLSFKNITEMQYLEMLEKSEKHEKYNHLQEIVNFLKPNVSPRTVRQYFDNLFKYFLMQGTDLDYTQKRIRITFPRIIEKRFEGLDRDKINRLLDLSGETMKLYLCLLVGTGMRESEGLQITPRMILFDEFPIRLNLPGEITKLSIPRETFMPPLLGKKIKEHIEKYNIGNDSNLFGWKYSTKVLEDYEKRFAKIRTKANLDTPNRKNHQQNDFTLHSFRAFFITTFTNAGFGEFGHALAGHSGMFSVYYRMSESKRKEMYGSVMNQLEF